MNPTRVRTGSVMSLPPSCARQPLDDRPELVEAPDEERVDPEPLAQLAELLDEPVDRADEQVRRVDDLLLGQLAARSAPASGR